MSLAMSGKGSSGLIPVLLRKVRGRAAVRKGASSDLPARFRLKEKAKTFVLLLAPGPLFDATFGDQP